MSNNRGVMNMNVLNYNLRFRPVRIGWCLRNNDWAAYQEILKLNFITAGGQFNPLIPIDDEDYAKALIKAFRVDLLLSVTEVPEICAFIAKFPHLTHDLRSQTFWDNFPGFKIPKFVDVSHGIIRYFEQAHKNSSECQFVCYDWQEDDPLAHVLLASLGKIPPKSPKEIDYLELLGKSTSVHFKTLTHTDPFPIPPRDPHVFVPSLLCNMGVQQHYRYSNPWRHAGLYIGHADNFQDLINFWNLKATNTPIAFYDPEYSERFHERKQDWLSFFPPLSKQTIPDAPPLALWCQTFNILDKLEKWNIPTNRCMVNARTWNGANIQVPYMYFSEHQVIGIQTTSSSGTATVSIQCPVPPFNDEPAFQSQQMVIALQSPTINFVDNATTLQLPFIPQLNTYYNQVGHLGMGLNCTRIEPDGIGFIQELRHRNLSFRPIKVTEIVSELFAQNGIKASLSDAGLTTQRLIHQMGGLQQCRLFKIPGVRKLIKQFDPQKEFTWGSAATIIRDKNEQTEKCSFENYSHVNINGKKLNADAVMETFLNKRVFSAGLKLTCPNCLFGFWASNQLPAPQTCDHCQHTFNILPYLKKHGAWHFRPSGLFAIGRDREKGGDQKGAIPTMLTLQQLEHVLGWGEILYSACTNFHKKDTKFECESDFIIILPEPNLLGKIEIVIAECKSEGGEITEEDVKKLGTLADALPEEYFKVYIVFSKLTRFSEAELNIIAPLNTRDSDSKVIIFTTRDLEALHPYEELLREHRQTTFGSKLQDMANITEALILSNSNLGYPKI